MDRTAERDNQIDVDFERQRDLLRQQQAQDARVLEALYNVSLACRNHPSFREIFDTIHDEFTNVFPFDAFYIALCDEEDPELFRVALLVDEGERWHGTKVDYGLLTGRLVHERAPLLFHDLVAERERAGVQTTLFGNLEKRSRSWAGVPLMVGTSTVGAISIQSYTPNLYSKATVDTLQRIANVIAVALENVVLLEQQSDLSAALLHQVDDRTRELDGISAVAAALVLRQPLQTLLDRALSTTLALLDLDGGNVRLVDGDTLVLAAQQGFSAEYSEATARPALIVSPLQRVVRDNKPYVVSSGWYEHLDPSLPKHVIPPFVSLLSVPLAIDDHVLGALSLFGYAAHDFSTHDVNLAQVIANQIAIMVENARLLEERERQIAELRALSSVSHAASTALDLMTLLRQVHDALQAFISLDVFSMLIYDPERQVVTAGISIDKGRAYDYWANQSPPEDSLTARIIRTREPLYFQNLPLEVTGYVDLHGQVIESDRPALSWVGVPLLDREEQVIGLINVQSYTAGVFSKRDQTFLQDVAAQVSLHVQNVRLLTQRERQIRELNVIGEVGTLVSASYDLDQMFAGVRDMLTNISSSPVFYLLVCEPQTRVITHAIFAESGERLELNMTGLRVRQGSLTNWILDQREPLLLQDLPEQAEYLASRNINPQSVGPAYIVRSWVGVPLIARDGELIGVLALQDYRAYRFDAQMVDFLSQVASHISLGIQKVRLFEERERQAAHNAQLFSQAQDHAQAAEQQALRMKAVHRIALALSTRLDQQEICTVAVRELAELFAVDHSGIILFDAGLQWGRVAASYPNNDPGDRLIALADNPLIVELATTQHPVVITSTADDLRAAVSRQIFQYLNISASIILPLISRNRLIGAISIDSYGSPLLFDEKQAELAMTIATSIAAAVENARLFAAEHEARNTADTLREMSRVISSSFDPNEVLTTVLSELDKVIPYDTASVMLLEGNQLRIVAWQGTGIADITHGATLPMSNIAAGNVVRWAQPVLNDDVRMNPEWRVFIGSENIRAWLGVPLMTRGQVLGVLNIDSNKCNRFTERDVAVAQTFANHAAAAIQNAQLYQESVARVEQEIEIAQRIQRNLFPATLPCVSGLQIAARCIPARETGGDFYDAIVLDNAQLGIVVGDVSGKSLPAAMIMAIARSTVRSEARNHGPPRAVLSETNRWLIDDVPRNAFVALNYAVIDTAAQRLTLTNAGQLTPLLRRTDGTLRYLDTAGPTLPLGMVSDVGYDQLDVALETGDTVVFYTDGIVEAQNSDRELFGFERLEELVAASGHLPPSDCIDHMITTVRSFAGSMPQHDDMTLVVVRVVA